MNSIKNPIREFIIEQYLFGNTSGMPDDNASLRDSGIIDSAGVLSLVIYIEETFGITVSDEDVHPKNLDSITNICMFIKRKQGLITEVQR